jgi:hypothetical protein
MNGRIEDSEIGTSIVVEIGDKGSEQCAAVALVTHPAKCRSRCDIA